MEPIIPRNSSIPCQMSKTCTTEVQNQRTFAITVLEGEEPLAQDNYVLDQKVVGNLAPGQAGQISITVKFNIDVDSIFSVKVMNERSGNEA